MQMKTFEEAKSERLIKEANILLDRIETNLRYVIESIKEGQLKKAS
jgi:hypothetical protein